MLWTRLPEKLRTATVCYHRYMTKVGSKEIPMNVELEKWIQALKKLPPLQQQYTAQTCRANKKGNILNLCSWKPNKFAKTCNTTTAILVRVLGNRFPCTYVCMGFMFVLYFRRILCVYECVCGCVLLRGELRVCLWSVWFSC